VSILKAAYPNIVGHLIRAIQNPVSLYNHIKKHYGEAISANVYKIIALETAHFKSKGWTQAFSPGMEPASKKFPWGWDELAEFWHKDPFARPMYIIKLMGSDGNMTNYLLFATPEAAFHTVAEFLKDNGNNPGAWNSTDAGAQMAYVSKLNNIALPS
jgi:hypothetical protein